MDGMLYAGVLRSPYSSARVLRIDAEKARTVPVVDIVLVDGRGGIQGDGDHIRRLPRLQRPRLLQAQGPGAQLGGHAVDGFGGHGLGEQKLRNLMSSTGPNPGWTELRR